MSRNRASRREIITLDEVPRSRTPEPAPKRPRTSRSYSRQSSGTPSAKRASRASSDRAATDLELELERDASSDQDPQATIADPEQRQMLRLDPYPHATNASPELERAILADSASRDTSAMEPQVEEPEEGPGEAAVGKSRENDPVGSWSSAVGAYDGRSAGSEPDHRESASPSRD